MRIGVYLPFLPRKLMTGKAPLWYWRDLVHACRESGIELKFARTALGMSRLASSPSTDAVIHVFNEVRAATDPGIASLLERLEQAAEGKPVIHTVEAARLIANKILTNNALSAAGAAVPRMYADGEVDVSYPVFSNEPVGTHTDVRILERGPLPAGRYNTELVDTRFEILGKPYQVSIRAMCAGREIVTVFPRMVPVELGTYEARNLNTPLDAALFDAAYRQVVEPRMAQILEQARRIGEALPFGFFSHDLLPTPADHSVKCCETGWKFIDASMVRYTRPIAAQIATFKAYGSGTPRAHAQALRAFVESAGRSR